MISKVPVNRIPASLRNGKLPYINGSRFTASHPVKHIFIHADIYGISVLWNFIRNRICGNGTSHWALNDNVELCAAGSPLRIFYNRFYCLLRFPCSFPHRLFYLNLRSNSISDLIFYSLFDFFHAGSLLRNLPQFILQFLNLCFYLFHQVEKFQTVALI